MARRPKTSERACTIRSLAGALIMHHSGNVGACVAALWQGSPLSIGVLFRGQRVATLGEAGQRYTPEQAHRPCPARQRVNRRASRRTPATMTTRLPRQSAEKLGTSKLWAARAPSNFSPPRRETVNIIVDSRSIQTLRMCLHLQMPPGAHS